MQLVLATANKGKIQEILSILSDLRISFLSISSVPGHVATIESGLTYAENASAKARAAARLAGMWALADDSGLEIDALGREPGPHSSRFLGPGATDRDRNQRILELLKGIPVERRTASFHCTVALAGPGRELFLTHGTCDGIIAQVPAGDEGFGYDPIFVVPERGVTMASLPFDVKNRISHRARAIEKTKRLLQSLSSSPPS